MITLLPFSTLDYKDHLACILFFSGCNLACKYCYNQRVVNKSDDINWLDKEQIFKFLKSRKNLLNGVVFSGGECTNHKWFLEILKFAKELGFSTKVDTNGTNQEILLNNLNYIDYIALDFKAPKDKMKNLIGLEIYENLINLIKNFISHSVNFEIRTTFDNRYLSNDDIIEIYNTIKNLGYKNDYFIQACFIDEIKQEYENLKFFDQFDDIKLRGFNTLIH